MGQEFVIKSTNLEDKINELLPAQGGYEPGVDLSASTQIIPIVDLTEAASGSILRQDLQVSLSKSGSFNSESREKFFDSWYENFKINRYTGDYTHAVIIKYKAKAKEDEPIVHEGNCKVRQKKF